MTFSDGTAMVETISAFDVHPYYTPTYTTTATTAIGGESHVMDEHKSILVKIYIKD